MRILLWPLMIIALLSYETEASTEYKKPHNKLITKIMLVFNISNILNLMTNEDLFLEGEKVKRENG